MDTKELCGRIAGDDFFAGMAGGFAVMGSTLQDRGDRDGYWLSHRTYYAYLKRYAERLAGRAVPDAELGEIHAAIGEQMIALLKDRCLVEFPKS